MNTTARLSLYPPPETGDDRYAWGCFIGSAIASARDHGLITELAGEDGTVAARIMPPESGQG